MPIDPSAVIPPDTPLSKLPNFDPRKVPVVGVDQLEAQFGVGVVFFGGLAGQGGGGGADVLEGRGGLQAVAVDDVLRVLGQEPEAFLALP